MTIPVLLIGYGESHRRSYRACTHISDGLILRDHDTGVHRELTHAAGDGNRLRCGGRFTVQLKAGIHRARPELKGGVLARGISVTVQVIT